MKRNKILFIFTILIIMTACIPIFATDVPASEIPQTEAVGTLKPCLGEPLSQGICQKTNTTPLFEMVNKQMHWTDTTQKVDKSYLEKLEQLSKDVQIPIYGIFVESGYDKADLSRLLGEKYGFTYPSENQVVTIVVEVNAEGVPTELCFYLLNEELVSYDNLLDIWDTTFGKNPDKNQGLVDFVQRINIYAGVVTVPEIVPDDLRLIPGVVFYVENREFHKGLYVDPNFTGHWKESGIQYEEWWGVLEFINTETNEYILRWIQERDNEEIVVYEFRMKEDLCYVMNGSVIRFTIVSTENPDIFYYTISGCDTGRKS